MRIILLTSFIFAYSINSSCEEIKHQNLIPSPNFEDNEQAFLKNNIVHMKLIFPIKEHFFSVLGQDDDENGIRDDIQNWILKSYKDPNVKEALFRLAFYRGKQIENIFNKEMFLNYFNKAENTEHCLFMIEKAENSQTPFPPSIDFEFRFYNNWLRKRVRKIGTGYVSKAWQSRSFEHAISQCGFKIQGLDKLINQIKKDPKHKVHTLDDKTIHELLEKFNAH